MKNFLHDLRYAFRLLLKSPGFTIGALLALALGIGANTAIFSVVYSTLIKPLPYTDPDRLVMVWERDIKDPGDQNVANPANFEDWREQNRVFEDIGAVLDRYGHITSGGDPLEVVIQFGTPNFFKILGAKALIGRTFLPGDESEGEPVAVLSHGLWLRRFGGSGDVIGSTIDLRGRKTKILGVMPPDFQFFIKKGSFVGKPAEIWLPYPITSELRSRTTVGRFITPFARLKKGVTVQQARAEMDIIAEKLTTEYREFNAGWGVNVVPIRDQMSGSIRGALYVLMGAVGFVLLIACANVANLMMVRAVSRSREIAVRSALGAGRWAIVRQLLVESGVLAISGGIAGLLLAYWALQAMQSFRPVYGIQFNAVKINTVVLLYTLGLSLLTAFIFGLMPAVQMTRWNLQEHLKESSRGVQLGSSKTRNSFVVIEVALALILLVGSGLLIRSFVRLLDVNPGFNPKNVLTVRINLPGLRYEEDHQVLNYFQEATQRVRALPIVESVGATTFIPFGESASGTNFFIEGRPAPPPGEDNITMVYMTDANFFKTMQIPLIRGRIYTDAEVREPKRVVVISETLAKTYFPNEDPIGKRLTINMRDPNPPTQIIGIVGDVKHESLDAKIEPAIYWPHSELAWGIMTLVIRVKGDLVSAIPMINKTLRPIDPQLAFGEFRTLEETMGDSYAKNEFNMILLFILAFVAVALAMIGIYGVMSHSVAQRTQEMGIRMALGARAQDLLTMILKQGGKLILIGTVIGIAGGFAVTSLMESLLFGTSTTDLKTFFFVTLTIVLVAFAACWIPAKRASKVDPITALHYE
jgi:putative ABC transport system permease protein